VPYFNPSDKGLNEWTWVPQEYPDLFTITDAEYDRLNKEMAFNPMWGTKK
jgi:hypothetical protein